LQVHSQPSGELDFVSLLFVLYPTNLKNYEKIGIAENWMVNYLSLESSRYISFPKRLAISICHRVEIEYQVRQFHQGDRIESPTFPEVERTTFQIFNSNA